MNQSGPAKFFPALFFSVMIGIGRFPHGRNAVAIHSGLRRIYRKPSFYIRSTSQTRPANYDPAFDERRTTNGPSWLFSYTSCSIVSAASRPRALEASGLSPVRRFRSLLTCPEIPSLHIRPPRFFSSPAASSPRWPGR